MNVMEQPKNMLVLKYLYPSDDHIAWAILNQQKLLFTNTSNFQFVQPTNVSTLATYKWRESFKFLLINVKVNIQQD